MNGHLDCPACDGLAWGEFPTAGSGSDARCSLCAGEREVSPIEAAEYERDQAQAASLLADREIRQLRADRLALTAALTRANLRADLYKPVFVAACRWRHDPDSDRLAAALVDEVDVAQSTAEQLAAVDTGTAA